MLAQFSIQFSSGTKEDLSVEEPARPYVLEKNRILENMKLVKKDMNHRRSRSMCFDLQYEGSGYNGRREWERSAFLIETSAQGRRSLCLPATILQSVVGPRTQRPIPVIFGYGASMLKTV